MATSTNTLADANALSNALRHLRQMLLDLPPSGSFGFEGLVAIALESASGTPYRLAASGTQRGIDAQEAFQTNAIAFECKRYEAPVSRESVMAKLAELSTRKDIDLWILAATSPVSAQLAADVEDVAAAQGLECVILDWPADTSLPALAIAAAQIPLVVLREFLSHSNVDTSSTSAVMAALELVRNDPRFSAHEAQLRQVLTSSRAGFATLRQNNAAYLRHTLASRDLSRRAFGQAIVPAAADSCALARDSLERRVVNYLTMPDTSSPLFVLGDEGVGKSWLVMRSWLSLQDPPALFFLPPERLLGTPPRDASKAFLNEVASQFSENSLSRERLQRRLERWLRDKPSTNTEFIVYLDGMNQHPKIDWARVVDELQSFITPAGGRIVASSRTEFFNAFVSNRLSKKPEKILVPEWAPEERDALLQRKGIETRKLVTSVLNSLKNPRLLGIATELLSNDEIHSLEELSVGRLLFEHLRTANLDNSVPTPAHSLVASLSAHAEELLSRVAIGIPDDLQVFRDLDAVVEGLYFHPLPADPTRYSLSERGMRLALALAFLDRLRFAERNDRDIENTALELIGPVSALDDASEVLVAALAVGQVDESVSNRVLAAILVAFADTQNPNEDDFESFMHIAIRNPTPYTIAAEYLSLQGGQQPNYAWVTQAIVQASTTPAAWVEISPLVDRWLRTHSFDPSSRIVARPNDEQRMLEARAQHTTNVESLSKDEKLLFSTVFNATSDPYTLHRLAMSLLAGKPLAEFSGAIATFSLAMSVQAGPSLMYDDLLWLGSLNTRDWPVARNAILDQVAILTSPTASRSGKWAAVTLLRMTGNPNDACLAEDLARELKPDFIRSSWRRNERFCSVDPCDPEALRPENLSNAIECLAAIPHDKVFSTFGQSSADIDLDTVLPALARFEPDLIAAFLNAFAMNVISRNGMALRQGVIGASEHRAALESASAILFFDLRAYAIGDSARQVRASDQEFLSNLSLMIAVPHVDGERQMIEILRPSPDKNLFTSLTRIFDASSAPEELVATLLTEAVDREEERAQCYILDFLHSVAMPASLEDLVLRLCHSPTRARVHAMALIWERGTNAQLRAFVESGWEHSTTTDRAESHYGSAILSLAAEKSLVDPVSIFTRAAPEWRGTLALAAPNAAMLYSKVVATSLHDSVRYSLPNPNLEIRLDDRSSFVRSKVSISKARSNAEPDVDLQNLALNELDSIEAEAEENSEKFEAFRQQLRADAIPLPLNPLSFDEALAIERSTPGTISEWAKAILMADTIHPLLQNSALAIALALRSSEEEISLRIIDACSECPNIRIGRGLAHLSLKQRAVWSGRSARFHLAQVQRLNAAQNDHQLAMEVLAAETWGSPGTLDDYVENLLTSVCPEHLCRAIMVAGFRNDVGAWNQLKTYSAIDGLVGDALESSRAAFQRNLWAKHWHLKARRSHTSLEYWRASILMTKVADARSDLWIERTADSSRWYKLHFEKMCNDLKRRVDRTRSLREKTLFGRRRPADYLVSSDKQIALH